MRLNLLTLKAVCVRICRCLLLAGFLLPAYTTLQAQSPFTVKGTVRGIQNEPVAGAVVQEKGNNASGAITGQDGTYTIQVGSRDAVLVISVLGYQPAEEPVRGRNTVDITLEEDNIVIDDVVVTALGIRRQAKALGYAVAEVKGDDITAGRETNAILALSGKVAGVDINTTAGGPSGSTRVVIRGNSQLSGSNLPLYVVDGVPMDNSNLGSAGKWGGYDMGDGLSSINPDDIESVSVLKGASASALYGSRAGNGVVLITTKSAGKGQGLGIEFSTNFNAVMIGRSFDDYQREYGQGRNGRLTTDVTDASTSMQTAWGPKLDPSLTVPIYNGEYKPYSNINNNILSFFRTGWTTTNSVAMSKDTEHGDFRISVSDMRNADIVPNSDMSRTTFMIKGSAKLGKKITIEGRANYIYEFVNNRPALSDSPNNIGNALIGLPPNIDQKWLSESYKDENGRYNDWNGNQWKINPYWALNEMSNESDKHRIMGHLQFQYQILPVLSFQARAGTDLYNFRMTNYSPLYTPSAPAGEMSETSTKVYQNNYEFMVNYNQRFGDLEVGALFGGSIFQAGYESIVNTGTSEVDPNTRSILNYNNYTLDYIPSYKQVNSFFGSINLGYKDYLFLDATIRNDWSSTLDKKNFSYLYPSVSGSFIFSTLFDLERGALSFGKLRASWAKVGGDTDPFQLDLLYGLRDFNLGGFPLGQIESSTIPNRGILPTSTYSFEVGVDLRFFQSRLNIDLGYYYTNTKDQILALGRSMSTGFLSERINAGNITNQGVELSLTGVPVKNKNFEWSSTVNLSRNVNKVVELHPNATNYELANARWANASIYAMAGEAYGVIVGKGFARDGNGNVIYKDGLPTYGNDLMILGNGNYDFMMGWSNTFSYKGFSLGVLLDMKWGADLYSMSAMASHTNGTSEDTLEGRREWYESEELRISQNIPTANWTATGGYLGKGVKDDGTGKYVENDVYVNPQAYWDNIYNNTAEPYIYDASYIKLRELSLSYSLPSRLLRNSPLKGLSVTAYARNLWLIYTSIPNVDPESNYNNGNGQGFEYGSLPSRRTFGVGLSLKF